MQNSNAVKVYIKSADDTDKVLAEVCMPDGPHVDSHEAGDDTRYTLQVAFTHILERKVKVVFESDISIGSDPGLVFIP